MLRGEENRFAEAELVGNRSKFRRSARAAEACDEKLSDLAAKREATSAEF